MMKCSVPHDPWCTPSELVSLLFRSCHSGRAVARDRSLHVIQLLAGRRCITSQLLTSRLCRCQCPEAHMPIFE